MSARSFIFAVVAAGASFSIQAAPVNALQASTVIASRAGDAKLESAKELERQAAALYLRLERRSRAARLLERAAALRPDFDEQAVTNLILAARLRYYARDLLGAQTVMEEAAERALRAGFIVHSAHSFLDAAYVAVERKQIESARQLFASAERLSGSPHLADQDREYLARRIATIRAPVRLADRL